MTKSVLLSVVVLVLGASGCKSTPAPAPVGVLLITLDTTRADRLSPYGFMDVSMPHLERLAREGVVFDQAMSVAPLTLPAHVSLFTGLFPPRHGVRENDSPPLAKGHLTLAERLDAQGFATAASVGSVVLDGDRGLQQGFEQYSQVATGDLQGGTPGQRNAESVVNDAIHWLDTVGDSRFFLWTHLYDPHRPYDPPEPFASRHASDLYIGEIAYVDSQIGRLLDTLDRQRLLDRTIVVVAGDHGESLGEHGERDHGIFLYENVLRVPLIIRSARDATASSKFARQARRRDADSARFARFARGTDRWREPDESHGRRIARTRRVCRIGVSAPLWLEPASFGPRQSIQADRRATARVVRPATGPV